MSAKPTVNDLINDLRTAQKCLKRVAPELVLNEYIRQGSVEARFFVMVHEVLYDVVSLVVDQAYTAVPLPGIAIEPSHFGDGSGGFLPWILRKLQDR